MASSPRRLWQTLEQHDDPDGFDARHPDEFSELIPLGVPAVEKAQTSRRGLFKWMGVSAAIAAAACKRAPEQPAVPFQKAVAGVTPGTSSWYATACGGCAAGCGLLVKWRDGRPIKVEGNPDHPLSKGGVCAVGQATVLGLYDGDRAKFASVGGAKVSFEALDRQLRAALAEVKGPLRVVLPWLTGPAEDLALEKFLSAHPQSRAVRFDTAGEVEAIAEAHRQVLGRRLLPEYRLDDAQTVASFGADFLGTFLQPVALARQWADARRPERTERPLRHVQLESAMSLTGSNADERVVLAPSRLEATLFATVVRLLEQSKVPEREAVRRWLDGVPAPAAKPLESERLEALVHALLAGRAVVMSGSDSVWQQRLALAANVLVGQVPKAARSLDETAMTLGELKGELEEGKVGAVVFAGVNPVFSSPGRWEAWLEKVAVTASTNGRRDETAALVKFHAPESHPLESWGDVAPRDGLRVLRQPLLSPLFQTRERLSSFLAWANVTAGARAFVRGDAVSFEAALERGFIETPTALRWQGDLSKPSVAPVRAVAGDGQLELCRPLSTQVRDGEHANNAWLQELPDPISKTTWGQAAWVSVQDARRLGLSDGDEVQLFSGEASAVLPVLVQPGLAEGTVSVARGYGRRKAGHVGDGVGANVEALGEWVTLKKTGAKKPLHQSQTHASQEGREHARELTLSALRSGEPEKKPAAHGAAGKPEGGASRRGLWSGHAYPGHRWALAVDLNACTGCGACVIGCQAENNIPVVGAQEVERRREMSWVRIDRYYAGEPEAPTVLHQPMMCQHCENAPCETVCPVAATVHSSEGLNQQVYNRCVGTRYCANNCPTKVRRFNWFDYLRGDALARMVLNPDVVVRERGVMEKCSFCVQRIEEARGTAQRQMRSLREGDVRTACQQSCPTQALTFGDINDPHSAVAKKVHEGRAYKVLGELNVLPQVSYLSRVRVEGEES